MGNNNAYASPGIAATTPATEKLPLTALNRSLQLQPTSIPQLQQHFHVSMPSYSLPQSTTITSENRPLTLTPPEYQNNQNNQILHSPTPSTQHFPVAAGPPGRVEMLNNVKPATISKSLNPSDRIPMSFALPPLLATQPPPQAQQPQSSLPSEPPVMMHSFNRQVGNPGPVSDPWRARHNLGSNPYSQFDQNNYSSSFGGPGQAAGPMQPGPGSPWERNEYLDEDEFEQWSPESRYNRSQENISGWNYSDSRTNLGRDYRPDRGRPRNSSGYQDQGRRGNRRWRGHDQRR